MMKKAFVWSLVVIIITTGTILSLLFYKSISPYNVVKAFEYGKTNIVIEGEAISTDVYPIIDKNDIYIPIDIIKEYIYNDVELSKDYDRLYIDIKEPDFQLETDELTKRIKDGISLNVNVKDINDIHYLDIKDYKNIFDIKIEYIEETNILVINKLTNKEVVGIISNDTYLRPKRSSFSFKMDKLEKGEEIEVLKKHDKWIKVRTGKGYIGYILDKRVDNINKTEDTSTQLNEVRENFVPNSKINLAWEYVRKETSDISKESKIEGLDVVSPTWFSIVGKNGYIVNNADLDYVNEAHKKGYKVWGLVDNSFDKDLTHDILSNEKVQNNVIDQILVYSSLYDLDGINIDFENVYYQDRDLLTKFIERLTRELKKQNIVVSMDMAVPGGSLTWSRFYDRKELSSIVDYCMVMTYDEHWSTSPKSGSVASIDWVEKSIKETLESIPKDKLLLGIPFYTREWEETILSNGKLEVKSKALSMEKVKERIKKYNIEKTWIKEEGQNYIEYKKEGRRYRIWVEDEKSISLKASLVHKYNLAGTASWRKGFEDKKTWTVLNSIIKEKNNIEYTK